MASLNVSEWNPDQVADWLTGLGGAVARYVPALRARKLDGARLLALRCDDLDALGVAVIGHQELMLEAVEQLRNFQYELRRECVQQLAVRVSVVAGGVARALRHCPERLDTQTLADVARACQAVKPLACWLHRWSLCCGGAGGAGGAGADAWRLGERAARLLRLALEAATCAQRDRFADQPARDLRRNATATAAAADCIIQDVSDPLVLRSASLDAITLRQRGRPLGFAVQRSCCAHTHLTDIRFGSPAHASGLLCAGDEIVAVDAQCVVGWGGEAVARACARAARLGDLPLRVRRRAPPPHPHRNTPVLANRSEKRQALLVVQQDVAAPPAARAPSPASSDSDALSPPASPDHLHPDHTRMYPPKPRTLAQRRHSVSGGSPVSKRPHLSIEQFWQELQEQRAGENDFGPLYRRDKAVSCSTGLQLSPRPRTALGVAGATGSPGAPGSVTGEEEARRGRLDKSHSTPAYGPAAGAAGAGGGARQPPIPESPASSAPSRLRRITDEFAGEDDTDPDTSLVETVNPALVGGGGEGAPPCGRSDAAAGPARRAGSPPTPPPRPSLSGSVAALSAASPLPALRPVPRSPHTDAALVTRLKPVRSGDGAAHISPPLRTLTPRLADVTLTRLGDVTPHTLPRAVAHAGAGVLAPTVAPPAGTPHTTPPASAVRGIFPSARTRDLKKNNSLLAKRRHVSARALAARGGVCCGAVWQRVRAPPPGSAPAPPPGSAPAPPAPAPASRARWVPRHLLLTHNLLYAFRDAQSERADCMIYLDGFTASAAAEVKSRAHAFKVYHTGAAFYFACASREAASAWLQLLHRATLLPALSQGVITKQFSETDYSESESESESPEKREKDREREREKDRDREKDKDKSKFGSLRKLRRASRSASQESVQAPPATSAPTISAPTASAPAASLDRKYLRFFSRAKHKAKQGVPIPTEHYRSYRRAPPSSSTAPATPSPVPTATPTPTPSADTRSSKKLPKPINYIHASNPNLVDFEKSDLCARPSLRGRGGVLGGRRPYRPDHFIGLTLEEFMLQKQEEERRQVYTNRVLMGVERGTAIASAAAAADVTARAGAGAGAGAGELQERLRHIVPDVIYGELPSEAADVTAGGDVTPPPVAQRAGRRQAVLAGKPISIKGKDGYEKIVYPEDLTSSGEHGEEGEEPGGAGGGATVSAPTVAPPPPARPLHYSLRRNHKVHSGSTPERAPPVPPDRWARGAGPASGGSGGLAGAGVPEGEGVIPGGVARLRLVFAGRAADQETSVTGTTGGSGGSDSPGGGSAGATGAAAGDARGLGAQYPHLQCPPTFQPETYCLARLQPRRQP